MVKTAGVPIYFGRSHHRGEPPGKTWLSVFRSSGAVEAHVYAGGKRK